MSKTLALIIRSHGSILTNYLPETDISNILRIIPLSAFNIENLRIISLAKLGGVCYGDPNLGEFIQKISNYYKQHPKTTEEKIKEVFFNPMRPPQIKRLTDRLFGHSFDPEIVKVPNFFLEKLYTPYNKDSGVFIFSTDLSSFTFDEIDKIKTILQGLSNQLLDIDPETNNPRVNPETNQPTGHLFRHQIFESLKEFNINNLILIDLTCNAYTQTNPDYPLNTTIVNWLNGYLTHHNLRGGKYKKKLTSKKCKRRSIKCKRRSIKCKRRSIKCKRRSIKLKKNK